MTSGGAAVNASPSDVRLESYVRAKRLRRSSARTKVNRALIGAAVSMGARIEINDKPGYTRCATTDNLIEADQEAMEHVLGSERVEGKQGNQHRKHRHGDLSAIMPAIHPTCRARQAWRTGAIIISNPEAACVDSAKVQLIMLHKLLSDNAARANYIIRNKSVCFASKAEYFERISSTPRASA